MEPDHNPFQQHVIEAVQDTAVVPEMPPSHIDVDFGKVSVEGLIKECDHFAELAKQDPEMAKNKAEQAIAFKQEEAELRQRGLSDEDVKKQQFKNMRARHKERQKPDESQRSAPQTDETVATTPAVTTERAADRQAEAPRPVMHEEPVVVPEELRIVRPEQVEQPRIQPSIKVPDHPLVVERPEVPPQEYALPISSIEADIVQIYGRQEVAAEVATDATSRQMPAPAETVPDSTPPIAIKEPEVAAVPEVVARQPKEVDTEYMPYMPATEEQEQPDVLPEGWQVESEESAAETFIADEAWMEPVFSAEEAEFHLEGEAAEDGLADPALYEQAEVAEVEITEEKLEDLLQKIEPQITILIQELEIAGPAKITEEATDSKETDTADTSNPELEEFVAEVKAKPDRPQDFETAKTTAKDQALEVTFATAALLLGEKPVDEMPKELTEIIEQTVASIAEWREALEGGSAKELPTREVLVQIAVLVHELGYENPYEAIQKLIDEHGFIRLLEWIEHLSATSSRRALPLGRVVRIDLRMLAGMVIRIILGTTNDSTEALAA